MNLYEVHHDGHWLNGISVVVAKDEARALHLAKIALTEHGLATERVTVRRRLNTDEERCFVLWDGNY